MKKWVVFLFAFFFTNVFSQTVVSPQFSELKGMEDQQSNTHLFYRIYSSYSNDPIYDTNDDIYHFDLENFTDSLFLRDYNHEDPAFSYFRNIRDYTFWDNDFTKYIFVGSSGSWELGPFISRFDEPYINLNYFCCEVNQIDISFSNDSLLYAGGWIEDGTIRSFDGGFNWNPVIDTLLFLSLNPFDDNLLFLEGSYGRLYRSVDGASTFHLVDLMNENGSSYSFLYDRDQLHIYRLYRNEFRVSSNKGEAFSWETKFSGDSKIFINIDESVSGTIYLANNKNILISTDYGDNFSLYKTLDRKIVGIYKKPNSNKLYAATKYKLYEITPDTIHVIKSLPIPEEVHAWFPLSIGNYWVYEVFTSGIGGTEYHGDETIEIVDTATLNNGFKYFLSQRTFINGDTDTTFIRLDSLSGELYAYSFETWSDLFFDDLLAEAGDTVCYEYNPAWNCQIVQPDSEFTEFGMTTLIKKYFPQAPGWYFGHSLVHGIGLYETYNGDLVTFSSTLKGCIINGIVYGDTTVVSVKDEETPVATSFKLEQNYPNPFNPSTKIKYKIPASLNPSQGGTLVQLKVYDLLGNKVATLVDECKSSGEYEIEFNTSEYNLSSGVYFYQLKAEKNIITKKLLLLK